jgi:hypothetical protein
MCSTTAHSGSSCTVLPGLPKKKTCTYPPGHASALFSNSQAMFRMRLAFASGKRQSSVSRASACSPVSLIISLVSRFSFSVMCLRLAITVAP